MIKVENFCKTYSSKKDSFAVKNVSISVEKGHICALLGPNGSGKTTIIKALCGFHYPDSGTVFIDDIDVYKNPEMIMNNLGYVPEVSILPGDMIVYEFLEYCGKIHGLEKENLKSAITKISKQCSITKILGKKIKTLSKGYQQRVSFAQALIHNPQNLILDEPVSGLDPAQIVQMRSLIKELSETKAILMSTHLLQEVYSLCTEICIINNGELVAAGTESEILAKANVKTLDEAFVKYCGTSGEEDE